MDSIDDFTFAGQVAHRGLNLPPPAIPANRQRHQFGHGPFARLRMPPLPAEPGLYLWVIGGQVLYVGQTRTSLAGRLGSGGYSTISAYNTLARQPGRTNGGQQTNCRVNALANAWLAAGHQICIWYRVTPQEDAARWESWWMTTFGMPPWNRRSEAG